MKKLLTLLLTLLMVLTLVACNSKKEEPTPTVDEPVVVEKQEEVKQEEPVIVEETKQEDTTTKEEDKTKDVVDPSIYDYWVVVYDQYGNEISRTTAHYGTIVKDPDGKDVKVLTNTYFHTTVNYPSSKKKDDNPTPTPTPLTDCTSTDPLIYVINYADIGEPGFSNTGYIDEPKISTEIYAYIESDDTFKYSVYYTTSANPIGIHSQDVGKYYHRDGSNNYIECSNPSSHNLVGDYALGCSRSTSLDIIVNDINSNFVRLSICPHFKEDLTYSISFTPGFESQYTYSINGDIVTFDKLVDNPTNCYVKFTCNGDTSKTREYRIKAE